MGAPTSSPLRRRARDPDNDDDDAPEEGELRVPFPVGHESSSDTEDDDGQRRYLFQPRVEYDYNPEVVRRPPHHRCSPRLRRSLDALDILLLGPGAGGALPSPTTPSGECESDATLSDDDHHGGDNKNKKPAAVVLSDSDADLNAVSAGGDDGQAGTTRITIAKAAPAAFYQQQQQPPLREQEAQPPRAPQPPPDPPRRREREYTCKECGKVFASGVALGGHMRVHYTGPPIVLARKNKKRCLAPPPTTAEGDIVAAAPPVGLSLALSIKTEENIATAAPPVAAVGLSLGLSIKAEEEPPAAPAGGAVRVVRLFGMNISPQVQQRHCSSSRAPATRRRILRPSVRSNNIRLSS